jgi:hypothetical protein
MNDSWITSNWRAIAALVYLTICFWDFCIMPGIVFWRQDNIGTILTDVSALANPDMQKLVLGYIFAAWDPLTLKYAGLFHASFGAILGVSAWKRGTEQVEKLKQNTELARISANERVRMISEPNIEQK